MENHHWILGGVQGGPKFQAIAQCTIVARPAGRSGTLMSLSFGSSQRLSGDPGNGEQFTDLMEPLGLNWKTRRVKELALLDDLVPVLNKRAQGRDLPGLSAYEQK
jgi:hypothetical protein